MDELLGESSGLVVVPNPATFEARALLNLQQSGVVRLELLDVLGRTIHVLKDGSMAQGHHQVEIPMDMLQSGLYFLRMQQGSLVEVQRFVVK